MIHLSFIVSSLSLIVGFSAESLCLGLSQALDIDAIVFTQLPGLVLDHSSSVFEPALFAYSLYTGFQNYFSKDDKLWLALQHLPGIYNTVPT